MRILLLSNTLTCGGAERQIVYLATLLKKQGHEIYFVCCNTGNFYEPLLKKEGITVNWSYARDFELALRRKNLFLRTVSTLIVKAKIIRFIKRSNCDSVISFLELSNRLNCISSLFSKHRVITGERNAIEPNTSSLSWLYYKTLMGRSDYIVCNSYLAQNMWERNVPSYSKKLATIYNFIYKPKIQEVASIDNQRVRIVVPASYDNTRKNYLGLVKALCLLTKKQLESIKIDWYGNKPSNLKENRDFIEAIHLITENELSQTIKFHDKVQNIGEKMQEADIVAIFSHVEGLPNAICEALSLGKPIIMTRVSDYERLVNGNGYLCDSLNLKSIAETLAKIPELSHDDLQNMGHISEVIYNETFSEKVSLQKWLRII